MSIKHETKNRELTVPRKSKGVTFIQDTPPSNPKEGDTWYNTSNGELLIYYGGWVYPEDPDTCWEKNPPYVVISPSVQSITEDNDYVDFDVYIKNIDVGVCGNTTFTFTVQADNLDDFEQPEVIPETITLGPYQEGHVTLRVRDKSGAASTGVLNVRVVASAPEHDDGISNTVSVRLEGDAYIGCAKNAPSVSISPASQEISEDGGSVNYTVSITNNDTGGACDTVTFTLGVSDDNTTDFESSTLSQTTVSVAPGATETVTLTVRDKLGAATAGGVNHTSVTVTAPEHPTVTSSPVTTTLTDAAETGWIKTAPSVSVSPSSATIDTDGGTVNYTVTIRNNDSGVDAQAVTFTVTASDSNTTDFLASTLSQTSVTLSPGGSTTVTLTVRDKLGKATAGGRNTTTITVSATDHPNGTASVTTTLTGTAYTGCSYAAPSVTISPSSQTITENGGSVNYTVTIRNNDSGASCSNVTFTLSVHDSNTANFDPSTLSQTTVTLAPGASTTVTLTVKDKAGNYPNAVVTNNTYVTVTAPDHPTANSNTVATSIDGYAANLSYGYFIKDPYGDGEVPVIERFTLPFDAGRSSNVVGYASREKETLVAVACSTHAYIVAGDTYTTSTGTLTERFDFPFDSGVATALWNLRSTCASPGETNSSIEAYIMGGEVAGTVSTTDLVSAITFADDGRDIVRAHLAIETATQGGCSSSQYAYSVLGYEGHDYISYIQRLAFGLDGATATVVATRPDDLPSQRYLTSFNSSSRGYIVPDQCGNYYSQEYVWKFDFPLDSGYLVMSAHISECYEGYTGTPTSQDRYYGYFGRGSSAVQRMSFAADDGATELGGSLVNSFSNRIDADFCTTETPHLWW